MCTYGVGVINHAMPAQKRLIDSTTWTQGNERPSIHPPVTLDICQFSTISLPGCYAERTFRSFFLSLCAKTTISEKIKHNKKIVKFGIFLFFMVGDIACASYFFQREKEGIILFKFSHVLN